MNTVCFELDCGLFALVNANPYSSKKKLFMLLSADICFIHQDLFNFCNTDSVVRLKFEL